MPVEELAKLTAQKTQIAFERPLSKRKKNSARLTGFFFGTIVLALCFSIPLFRLLKLAMTDELYSEIPLIPLVSLYLLWLRRKNLPQFFESSPKLAAPFFAAGLLTLAIFQLALRNNSLPIENVLVFQIFALLLFFTGVCAFFLGKNFLRAIAFPIALLIFTIPFPEFLRRWLETSLQHGSAIVAGIFFQLSGTAVLQDGLNFKLPGCFIQVAPECSGIHSTLVLAITSLLAGWIFLRSPWRRAVLALAVIPLALLRNGFRIFVIGRLCAAFGPKMLDAPIHRHGGPLFFALSLIPFFLLLFFLKKTERTNHEPLAKKLL